MSSERILKIDTIAEGKHDGAVVALIEEITQRGKSVVITEVELDICIFVTYAYGDTQIKGLHERFHIALLIVHFVLCTQQEPRLNAHLEGESRGNEGMKEQWDVQHLGTHAVTIFISNYFPIFISVLGSIILPFSALSALDKTSGKGKAVVELIPQFCTGRKPELVFFLHIIVAGIVINLLSTKLIIIEMTAKTIVLFIIIVL